MHAWKVVGTQPCQLSPFPPRFPHLLSPLLSRHLSNSGHRLSVKSIPANSSDEKATMKRQFNDSERPEVLQELGPRPWCSGGHGAACSAVNIWAESRGQVGGKGV